MRKVIVGTFVSLDGVMQAPGGPEEDADGAFALGGWTVPYFDDTVGAAMHALFARPYALLLGRKTYDIFAAYWPQAEDGPDGETARAFNGATKYVATSSATPLTWRNSVSIHDPATDVALLKRESGPDLVVQGSSVLLATLFAHGLVDELTTLAFPVVLGKGKRLFDADGPPFAMTVVRSQTSPSGVTITTYKPAGPVQTGSFG